MIDLGGYIGLASLYVVNKYPSRSAFLIEPDYDNFILATLDCRPYSQITCYNAGVWSSSGELVISEKHCGDWGTTVRLLEKGEVCSSRIKALSVPDILKLSGFSVVDFMKIDIEGSEKVLFESPDAPSWISRCGMISCELHDRFTPGCSTAFHAAVTPGFEHHRHGEYDYYINKHLNPVQFV